MSPRRIKAGAVALGVAALVALSGCTEKIENMPEPLPNQTSQGVVGG